MAPSALLLEKAFDLAAPRSFRDMIASADQAGALLAAVGIRLG